MIFQATNIFLAIATETDARFEIRAYTDDTFSTAANVTGVSAEALVKDTGGTTRTYAITWDVAASGEGHFTLTGSQHTDAGEADVQIFHDSILKGRFTIEFVLTLA